ncbi:MAG TPA: hypothetical protein PLO07_00110 [Rubrivivax sp.]|nr:hypothetical protein [Rubrivivax sp.]
MRGAKWTLGTSGGKSGTGATKPKGAATTATGDGQSTGGSSDDGPTPPDGPNLFQNAPVLTAVRTSTEFTNLQGTLSSAAGTYVVSAGSVTFQVRPAWPGGDLVLPLGPAGELSLRTHRTPVDVVMDARMGEVYAGRCRWTPPRWQVLQPPALLTLPALHARWAQQPPLCVAGTALPAFGDALRCGAALRADGRFDRAAALARVAQQRWRDAGGVDAAAALPLYLRDKVALTTAERDALRAAAR